MWCSHARQWLNHRQHLISIGKITGGWVELVRKKILLTDWTLQLKNNHFPLYILDLPGLQALKTDMGKMFFCVVVIAGFLCCSSSPCNACWNAEGFCYWPLCNSHMSWPRVSLHLHMNLGRSLRSNYTLRASKLCSCFQKTTVLQQCVGQRETRAALEYTPFLSNETEWLCDTVIYNKRYIFGLGTHFWHNASKTLEFPKWWKQ